ncbi:sec-independent protein translocase protein TatA [Microvirga flocculans]|uniref:Sec-independent protein translocase protein TatA n=1 Tax=Microvirga flocculans TaxID=217168 RepID=A0A7W6IDS7_9HYPH|nr:twin-arginine translocase TatA/TatE family subunit [Microvirga flocculans]MBB4039636.1 sec-independent protein translocase protein TatA [Microvirga flocculans]
MGGTSIWHWIVVGLIVVLLFGRGKISDMMGDVAKGIKAFKKGMAEDDTQSKPVQPSEPVRTIDHQAGAATGTATTDHKVG